MRVVSGALHLLVERCRWISDEAGEGAASAHARDGDEGEFLWSGRAVQVGEELENVGAAGGDLVGVFLHLGMQQGDDLLAADDGLLALPARVGEDREAYLRLLRLEDDFIFFA